MRSASDFSNMNLPGITKEMREQLAAAFNALSNWRDEIESVNERSLAKLLDQTSEVARSMGWPDQAITATRKFLENTSKTQSEMIDNFMDGCEKQLKSPNATTAIPRSFTDQTSRLSEPVFGSAMPDFSPFAPWTFWMQAAEMWQHAVMPDMAPRKGRSH